jgi:hypothetical protein
MSEIHSSSTIFALKTYDVFVLTLKEVAFIPGKSENQGAKKFLFVFSLII